VSITNSVELLNVTIPASVNTTYLEELKDALIYGLSLLYPAGSIITIISIGDSTFRARRLDVLSNPSIYYLVTLPSLSCTSTTQCETLALQTITSVESTVLSYSNSGEAQNALVEAAQLYDIVYLIGVTVASGQDNKYSNCGSSISFSPTSETLIPTSSPTIMPTNMPSSQLNCQIITFAPTAQPSHIPSSKPTTQPTVNPTVSPTSKPTIKQSVRRTLRPSNGGEQKKKSKNPVTKLLKPTKKPVLKPTKGPRPVKPTKQHFKPTQGPKVVKPVKSAKYK
jgi:hypothetical protein